MDINLKILEKLQLNFMSTTAKHNTVTFFFK